MSVTQTKVARPRAIVRAIVALVSLVLILVALEVLYSVALRLLDDEEGSAALAFEDPDPIVASRLAAAAGTTPLVEHPRWLWQNQASVDITVPVNPRPYAGSPSWNIVTDTAGLREPKSLDEPDPAASGVWNVPLMSSEVVYTILCAGDSSTFGYNVDSEETYPRQLEKLLRERHPDASINVINGGVPGWTWVQGTRFLEEFGLQLEPDAVIASYGTNDRFWLAWRTDREYMEDLEDSRYRLKRAVSRLGSVRLASWLIGRSDPTHEPSPGCLEQLENQGHCRRVDPAQIEESVRRFDALTKARGTDLVLLNSDYLGTGAVTPLRRVADSDGLRLLDAVSELGRGKRRANMIDASERGLERARMPNGIRYDPDDPDAYARPREILLRVAGAPVDMPLRVKGGKLYEVGFEFDEEMVDDGTHGDEVAGDGVHSQSIWVPQTVANLRYRYFAGGEPEFEPLPPLASVSADRNVIFTDHSIGWIDKFAERFMMVDRAHPNAQGHAVVAEMLVPIIEELSSFEAFIEAQAAVSPGAPPVKKHGGELVAP
jgi:lysophospholipase L1-like esterase